MMRLFIITIVLICSLNSFGQSTISGIFQLSEAELIYKEGLNWQSFVNTNDSLARNGYRLTDLETIIEGKKRSFWGIWIKSDQPSVLESVYGWPNFVKKKREMAADSFLLTEVEAYAVSNEEHYYIGVWTKSDVKHKVWKFDSREGLAKKTEEMARQDFFVMDVEAFPTPNKTLIFLALYHKGKVTTPRNYVYTTNDLKAFQTSLMQREKSGFRLFDIERFEEKGQRWYLALFEKGDYKTIRLSSLQPMDFMGRWEILEEEGLLLMDIELE
jgi:hypothetical protein